MPKRNSKIKNRPRAVIIHGLAHAQAACTAARLLNVPIELHSTPDAVAGLGPHWFQKLLDEIELKFPDVQIEGVLDCGDSAGLALAALRQGLKRIRFTGPKKVREKIRGIARQQMATVDTAWPETLDLGHQADPATACRDWLDQ